MRTIGGDAVMEHSTSSVSDDIRCEVCNLNVEEGDNFCRYCGHSLRPAERTSLTVAPQNAVQQFWESGQIPIRRGVAVVAVGAIIGALARSSTGRSLLLGVIDTSLKNLVPRLTWRRESSSQVKAAEETIVIRRTAIVADK